MLSVHFFAALANYVPLVESPLVMAFCKGRGVFYKILRVCLDNKILFMKVINCVDVWENCLNEPDMLLEQELKSFLENASGPQDYTEQLKQMPVRAEYGFVGPEASADVVTGRERVKQEGGGLMDWACEGAEIDSGDAC